VVDDVSKDRTAEIVREYTSNIVVNDSKGSFHVNKNFGIEESSGDWILSIDAYENITAELIWEIKDIIHNTDPRITFWAMDKSIGLIHLYILAGFG
jgi:glycosyltransferase involved in cell wall biosynthesis